MVSASDRGRAGPDPVVTERLSSSATELIARVLRCPDCNGSLDSSLRCACGRAFQPAADGIYQRAAVRDVAGASAQRGIQAQIESHGAGDSERGIVQYERAFHDEQASHYDSLFADPLPLKSHYRHLVHRQIHAHLRGAPFIVDLCCGTGKSSGPLLERGMTVVGVDVPREMLRIYRQKYPGQAGPILIHADASHPPLRDGSCAELSMIGGLHHIPDKAGSLESCSNALAPGGVLILHEPLKTGRHSRLASFCRKSLRARRSRARVGGRASPVGHGPLQAGGGRAGGLRLHAI